MRGPRMGRLRVNDWTTISSTNSTPMRRLIADSRLFTISVYIRNIIVILPARKFSGFSFSLFLFSLYVYRQSVSVSFLLLINLCLVIR